MIARGLAASWPAGLVEAPTVGGASTPIRLKANTDQQSPPPVWSQVTPGTPDYSLASMFDASVVDFIQIDAHSTGNDLIPTPSASGIPDVNAAAAYWLGYVVSVKNGALGTNGSYVDGLSRSVGADLLSYYPFGVTGIAPTFAGATMVEATAMDLGYSAAVGADLTAFDYGIGVHAFDLGDAELQRFFRFEDTYYFSVSSASALNLSGTAFARAPGATGLPTLDAHPADVYLMTWDRMSESWSSPEVFLFHSDLQLDRSTDDIDALAVDGTGNEIIFSTTIVETVAPRPQLMIAVHQGPGVVVYPQELMDSGATVNDPPEPVTSRINLRRLRDDVDTVCVIDPESMTYERVVGTPEFQEVGNATPMGLSMSRGAAAVGGPDEYHFHLTGWGAMTPARSDIYFAMRSGAWNLGVDPDNYNDWSIIGPLPRWGHQSSITFSIDPLTLFGADSDPNWMTTYSIGVFQKSVSPPFQIETSVITVFEY